MGFTPVTKCVWNVQMFPSGNREPIRCNTSSPQGGLNVLSSPIHKITNKQTHTAPCGAVPAWECRSEPCGCKKPNAFAPGAADPALQPVLCVQLGFHTVLHLSVCWRWIERATEHWLVGCMYPAGIQTAGHGCWTKPCL